MRPTGIQGIETYMTFCVMEKGVGFWVFKEKEDDHRKMGRAKVW